jgi:hypothetical protein
VNEVNIGPFVRKQLATLLMSPQLPAAGMLLGVVEGAGVDAEEGEWELEIHSATMRRVVKPKEESVED